MSQAESHSPIPTTLSASAVAVRDTATPPVLADASAAGTASGSASAPRIHLGYVDGLRALAALYVVCVHLLPRTWGATVPNSAVLRLLAKVLAQGHFAVTAFIVISGFCLMLPVVRAGGALRGGTARFFRRRFWRIVPPFYGAFLISALLLMAGRGTASIPAYYPDASVSLKNILGHLLLVQNAWPGALLPNNGPLWSVSTECQIYLTFPFLVWLWRRIGPTRSTGIFLAGGYGLVLALQHTPLSGVTFHYLGAFALGALAAGIAYGPTPRWSDLRLRIPWGLLSAILLGTIAALCAAAGWKRAEAYALYLDLPIAVAVTCLLIWAAQATSSPVKAALSWKPLAALGTFSYSLYLIHYPLADVFCAYILGPLHLSQSLFFAAIVLGVIPAILALAYGYYAACERPFQRLAQRL